MQTKENGKYKKLNMRKQFKSTLLTSTRGLLEQTFEPMTVPPETMRHNSPKEGPGNSGI